MEAWQAVVLAVQILLLAAGWLLFQRARGELSARAAETPVLAEVRALQKNVKQLLQEMESAADRQAQRLENGCADAAEILVEIENTLREAERRLEQYEETIRAIDAIRTTAGERFDVRSGSPPRRIAGEPEATDRQAVSGRDPAGTKSEEVIGTAPPAMTHRENVFRLADSGETTASIARATRLSEGEVEVLLSLRGRR